MKKLGLILGNHLFDKKYFVDFPKDIFMCEDQGLCTHFKYHKHKIIHFLASMREFSDSLSQLKTVHYYFVQPQSHFESCLDETVKKLKIQEIISYEIEDKFFENFITQFCIKRKIHLNIKPSPMFLCSHKDFKAFLQETKKPLLNNFYIKLRKKYSILMDGDIPVGGQWNFDHDNRKKIPKNHRVQDFYPPPLKSPHINSVKDSVDLYFGDHPGESSQYWIPTKRDQAIKWFDLYLEERFHHFGDFQDALDPNYPFLYHSIISPFLNIGFLTPLEVIQKVEALTTKDNLNSVEGFIRQVLGWREFVRGIYQNFDHIQSQKNFFNHNRKLTDDWYRGTTGIPPLDDAIRKAQRWGYCHHIERLMVISNIMLLLEVDPKESYRWFMEMFVDSSDWVMGPNVFGMGQFSDGGIFATKPYIAGSNYIRKMGHYKKETWCDALDGLYWQFIDQKRDFLQKNHRMNMMVKMFDKMNAQRKKEIFNQADILKEKITYS